MAKKMEEREVECETCEKKILRKEGIGIIVNNKIFPFFCCSYDCLSVYVGELCQHEELPEPSYKTGGKDA